jgi:hypothetical protein
MIDMRPSTVLRRRGRWDDRQNEHDEDLGQRRRQRPA